MSSMSNARIFPLGFFAILVLAGLQQACVPPTERVSTDLNLGFNDPEIRKVLIYQDKGLSDSIYPLFHHRSPGIRYAAVRAFASLRNVQAVDSLSKMLKDPVLEVRAMAAYALGQTGSEKAENALIAAFTGEDTLSVNNSFNKNILEALGRCGSKTTLKNIATVATYRDTDDELLLGQIRAIYRFGQRGIFDPASSTRAASLLVNNAIDESVQLMAAHYFGRFKESMTAEVSETIWNLVGSSDNPEIRMALAGAVSRSPGTGLDKKLLQILSAEKDYRVKCNLLRGFNYVEFDSIKGVIYELISDPNLHVAGLAADLIGRKGKKEQLYEYRGLITENLDWRIKVRLYQSMIKASPLFYSKFKNELVQEMLVMFNKSSNPYERAEIMRAIGTDPYQYLTLAGLKDKVSQAVEKTALIEALGQILLHPELIRAYGSKYVGVKSFIVNFLVAGSKAGDSGVVAASSNLLKDPKISAKGFVTDSLWFEESKSKLKLPQDLEAYNELLQARAYLFDSTYTAYVAPFNHPIDFNMLATQGDSIEVVMKTTKGNITLWLFPNKAPGSVANFIELCQKDFYDGKIFHRVVPNFVIQAGCPRGDGYGALNYTIRSELNLNYYQKGGLLGMAHAGNHTEGTQFFITHSPAPHLDGNYTIFGKVKEGMDVVHSIYQGDKIIDVIILKKS
ncbi:MAG: peptidylprolyl isomerase [Saprospiraceae bacterium]|nr:peptidylprolyl isomerase [Saprospiraceae bacterium]